MISATTHEFHRGKVENDGSCLYSSFRYVNGVWNTMNNKVLRLQVADRILNSNSLHTAVLERRTNCKTVKDYCERIKKGKLSGGEPEVRALSMLCRILIRQVTMTKNDQGKVYVTIFNYGEEMELFKECVYILYDEETKHYDPLYVAEKQNPDEKLTIFGRDDATILGLLRQFIHEKLHDVGFIQLDSYIPSHETERPTGTNLLNETEQMFDKVCLTASTKLPSKRKLPDYDNLVLARTIEEELSLPISDNNNGSSKRAKIPRSDTCTMNVLQENNSKSISVEQLFQTDMFVGDSEMEQQSTTEISVISNQVQPVTKIRFAVEPAVGFRGRTQHEFIPKKAVNRSKQPSSPRPPRYFSDRNGGRCLNLLISETILSADGCVPRLEICIVTPEINGYTYINPYFKLKVDPTDLQSANMNPIYKYLDSTAQLSAHSAGFQQSKLQLVVVMLRNTELMAGEQPLKVFSSPKTNQSGSLITKRFNNYDTFKKAYNLHGVRFAVTVCTKRPDQEEFERHDDIQYISQISKEDRKYIKPKK